MKIFRRAFLNRYGTLVCDEFRWLPNFNRCKLTINILSDWDFIIVVEVREVLMDQYLLIAVVIILFWLVGFGVYMIVSNRQRGLEGDLNHLSEQLGDDGTE